MTSDVDTPVDGAGSSDNWLPGIPDQTSQSLGVIQMAHRPASSEHDLLRRHHHPQPPVATASTTTALPPQQLPPSSNAGNTEQKLRYLGKQ